MEALYTAGIVAKTDQRPLDVINELAEAMGGKVDFIGDKLVVVAAAYVAPVIELGDDDFAGPIENLSVRPPHESRYNVVTGKIIDQAQGWKADVDFPRVAAQAYIDADGEEMVLPVEFGAVTRAPQAQQLAAVMLRRDRQALTFEANFKARAIPVQAFDVVEITNSRYGFDAKPFEVKKRGWTLEGLVRLRLQETDPSIFSFGNAFDEIDAAPNTNLPLAYQIEQLQDLAVQSGTSELSDGSIVTRVKVTWTQASDQSVLQNGKVEIQYIPATNPYPPADWPNQSESGSATETTIVGLRGGLAYVFRGRFIGMGGRVRGAWSSPQVIHIVAKPPAAVGQNLLINASFELDTANVADNWTPYSAGTTGSITHSDGVGIFGSRSQRLDCTNLGTSSGDRAGYYQGVNVTGLSGDDVTLSVYAEGTVGARLRTYVDWYNVSGGSIVGSSTQTHNLVSSAVERFSMTATVPASATYGRCHFWIEQRPTSAGAAFLRIDAAQLEPGTVATAFLQSVDEAIAAADAALASASAAAIDAANALAQLTSIASDSVLTANEKPSAILDYSRLINEQPGIDAQAIGLGISTERLAYDNAIASLTSYLGTLSGWNVVSGSNVAIVGVVWRSNWNAAYTSRQTLLNKIADEAARRAQWASVTGAGKPADNASADLVIVARGSCVATGNTIDKVGGASAWDSDAYSKNGYVGGAFAAGQVSNTATLAMVGLNSDPTTDQSFTSLDFAWYQNAGDVYIYENGSQVGGPWSCAPGDVLAVIYDGATVTYMQNNTLRRQVAAAGNLNLFLDTSFYTPNGQLKQIRFGPMSAVNNIGTGQLQLNSATELGNARVLTGTVFVNNGSVSNSARGTLTYTNNTGAAHGVQMEATIFGPGFGWNVSTPSVARVSSRYSSTSLGTVKKTMYDWPTLQPTGGNIAPLNVLEQVTVAAGETLTWEIVFDLTHTALADLSWTEIVTRLAAIKR